MANIGDLEKRRVELENLRELMSAKLKARPHDFGIRAWWGFLILGLLVGWIRSSDLWTMVRYGFAFCVAGLFFCIFALDSADVESKIAIFLYRRLGEKRISRWLYARALMIREEPLALSHPQS
jgi:hypothetical protein